MRLVRVGLALVTIVAAAAGCGDQGIGSSQRAIISGEVDLEDGAVVAVFLAWADGTDRLCTGTLVSPRVVLTAGHCLSRADDATRLDVGFGTDVRDQPEYDGVTWSGGIDYVIHPDLSFDSPTDGHDVGLVLLPEASAVTPAPLGLTPPGDGASVRAVGYGRTDRDLTDAGVKREVMATVTSVENRLFYFGDAEANTCLGDSGGPVFTDLGGTEVLVGISSFGDSRCRFTTGATRVDEYLFDLIYPWIAEHDPDAPPAPPAPPKMEDGGGCAVAAGSGPRGSGLLWLLAALITVLQQVRRLPRPEPRVDRHVPPHRVG
jgi:MYXO-CTERM domain-containing protein